MAPAVPYLIAVATAAAATQAGYQISEGESAKRRASRKSEEVSRDAASANNALRSRMENEESSAAATATQQAARRRQRRAAQGSQGYASTLLTGPSGLGDGGQGGEKTLLGL